MINGFNDTAQELRIHQEIRLGNLNYIKRLCENCHPGQKPYYLEAIFRNAVDLGDIDAIEYAVKQGIDLNVACEDGECALIKAARSRYDDVVKFLLLNGADINLKGKSGVTALMVASSLGEEDTIKELMAYKPDVNSQDNNGDTSLHRAVKCGHLEITIFLIENGADYKIKNNDGKDVLDIDILNNDQEIMQYLSSFKEQLFLTDLINNADENKVDLNKFAF